MEAGKSLCRCPVGLVAQRGRVKAPGRRVGQMMGTESLSDEDYAGVCSHSSRRSFLGWLVFPAQDDLSQVVPAWVLAMESASMQDTARTLLGSEVLLHSQRDKLACPRITGAGKRHNDTDRQGGHAG